ncbi:MAG: NAD-dependent epimerase/dehydratase family protein [Ilumatobacteraceae bacterium]
MVVGGAGFLGSHLVERMLADGHAVDVVDDLSSGSLANLAAARALGAELKIHTLDATAEQFASLVAMRTPDVIYHLGWDAAGEPDARQAGRVIHATVGLLDAARRLGSTKVVAALPAGALYGAVAARDLPVKEGHAWEPVGLRGVLSRAIADMLAMYRTEHAVEFTALVMANVYGPRQRPAAGVVAAFASAVAAASPATIHGDGRQARDFLYVDDAVDALARAAQRGDGLIVNIGTGQATSVRELWSMMAAPTSPDPVSGPQRPGEIGRITVSPTRARIHLAWAPWTTLATGLRSL